MRSYTFKENIRIALFAKLVMKLGAAPQTKGGGGESDTFWNQN